MPRLSASTNPRPRPSPMGARVRRFPLPPLPDDSPVKTQLDRILASRIFRSARRSQLFLRYILHHAVARPDEPLKEYSVAIDVFDRDTSYDPAVNNTVRVEAGRLRSRLCEYYAGEGHADPLVIEIPKGSYRAFIQVRESGRVPVTEPVPVPRPSPAAPLAAPAPGTPAPRQLRFLWAVPLAFLSACLSAIASY